MASSSKTYLLYHLIFSTKKRERSLQPNIRQSLFAYMGGIVKQIGGMPVIINGVWDHVHVLAFLPKHVSLSQSVQSIKGGSAYWFNNKRGNTGGKIHWQEGYQIFSVSGSHLEKIKDYIFQQDVHHRNLGFEQEMEQFESKSRECYNCDNWIQYPDLPDGDEVQG